MKTAIFLALFGLSVPAQVWLVSGPVAANPAAMKIGIAAGTNGITLLINSNAGQIANSCYVELNSTFLGFRISLYETVTNTPQNPQTGAPGW